MINQEIERKFLVKPTSLSTIAYWKENYPSCHIEQSYLNSFKDKNVIRVRNFENGDCFFEVKGPGKKSRLEIGFDISEEDYNKLKTKNSIRKTRYYIPSTTTPNIILHVDVYEEPFFGLITAEVEVLDKKHEYLVDSYIMDEFIDKEITYDKRYTNFHLSFKRKLPTNFFKKLFNIK